MHRDVCICELCIHCRWEVFHLNLSRERIDQYLWTETFHEPGTLSVTSNTPSEHVRSFNAVGDLIGNGDHFRKRNKKY